MKQRMYQIALNLLNIGNKISKLEKDFNKTGHHRCITFSPNLKLTERLYLCDSDFNIECEEIISQIERNLDEINSLLYSIESSIKQSIKENKDE